MGVTIRDVAARAEVSVATASRALSGRRGVSPRNRDRVLAAARDLGYEPNSVAAALRSRTTHTIGMVVPRVSNPFFATLVETVEQQLHEGHRALLLGTSHYDPAVEARQVRALLDRRVDALVAVPCHREQSRPCLDAAMSRVPTVQLDLRLDGHSGSWVGVDNEAGISQIVDHFVDQGVRALGYVGSGPTDSSAQTRLEGYHRATRRRGVDPGPVLLGEFSVEWGQHAAGRLVHTASLPEAIVCGSDTIALGVLRALTSNGIRVPDDVQVSGFDDIPYAELAEPPLTTMRQPQHEMAAEALRTLLSPLEGRPSAPRRTAVTPELVLRASTRPT